VLGLIAGGNQLRARLHKPGAKGGCPRDRSSYARRKNIARLQVSLRMVDAAVRYEVALDTEADGNRLEVSTPKPETRPSMGCDDDELSWSFEIPEDDLDGVWVIASWIDDHNAHLRMAALRVEPGHARGLRVEVGSRLASLGGRHCESDAPRQSPRARFPGWAPLELDARPRANG